MRESQVERAIKEYARALRLHPFKFVSPGCRGVPDLIILAYPAKIGFVEVKAPGGCRTGPQRQIATLLTKLGFPYICTDNLDDAKQFLNIFNPN